MKQKTAMQTLIDELRDYKRTTQSDKLAITFWIAMAEKLLEKEKEQIIDALLYNMDSMYHPDTARQIAEEYYNETYKQD